MLKEWIKSKMKMVLPKASYRWVTTQQLGLKYSLPIRWLVFRSLRRIHPLRPAFGYGYGQCIDRYYIEAFLDRYKDDIQGHVLEIADNCYTWKFGGDRVIKSDVLHATEGNPKATIIADLTCAGHIPPETFDCIILSQTLQFIYDVPSTIRTLCRILKPDGVLLTTVPGISQISRYDMNRWGEFWRFTTLSIYKLFTETFPENCITTQAYGNVLAAIALMHGLTSEELRKDELDYHDKDYEVLIAVRAVKHLLRHGSSREFSG